MYRDFDDFQDEHEYYRLKHIERLGIEPYGEDYFWYDCDLLSLIKNASVKDPADDPYDLDSLSLKDAKLLFQALGELAHYKGFVVVK